uniref:Lymphoid-restricted membrane protein n=1 Tax=Timema bartmani TaxID=61472 RepID=A0A7R9F8C0_9NEOP|nr:unnamed protein product [Timema bartmani]
MYRESDPAPLDRRGEAHLQTKPYEPDILDRADNVAGVWVVGLLRMLLWIEVLTEQDVEGRTTLDIIAAWFNIGKTPLSFSRSRVVSLPSKIRQVWQRWSVDVASSAFSPQDIWQQLTVRERESEDKVFLPSKIRQVWQRWSVDVASSSFLPQDIWQQLTVRERESEDKIEGTRNIRFFLLKLDCNVGRYGNCHGRGALGASVTGNLIRPASARLVRGTVLTAGWSVSQNRYLSLSLAFKTDKVTLSQRHELQHRQRDQAEKNMAAEVLRLKAAVHNLNRLCVDSESVEVLAQIQSQVDILQQSTNRVSTSAEVRGTSDTRGSQLDHLCLSMFGAVQQEHRLNKAVEVMLAHVDNLKRMHEKEHSELEETRRLLLENNIVVEDVADSTTEELIPRGRYRSLQAMVGNSRLGSKRRASIAALPRSIGSTDSIKSISSSGSFTAAITSLSSGINDPKSRIGTTVRRRTSVAPMLSTSQSEGLPIRWDSSDRLDKQDAMDEIKELSESRRESGASERRYSDIEVTPPSSLTEENNNKQQQQQQLVLLRPGPDGEVVARPILEVLPELMLLAGSEGDLSQDVSESEDADRALPVVEEEEEPGCLRAHINFILDRTLQLMDPFLPLDMEYLVRSARFGLAVVLLLAAVWCVGSSFFSSPSASASYQGCRPYSWRTYLQHKLNLYIKVKHLNEPPT